ncbi:hypothetical protein PQR62_08850 [Herbaspirillum lusitanum]|uniref:Secreted protein n=1 Tax=Herbaspirillum lusitanum TaxID=213312 RepID=A0ABW9A6A0_9BURK
MKRLWVLLLICLLPMQVFAAVLTYAASVSSTDFITVEPASSQQAAWADPVRMLNTAALSISAQDDAVAPVDAALIGDSIAADLGNVDENSGHADSGEDFSTHAGIGDEPVLMQAWPVIPESTRLAPMLGNDAISQPPFLPPAARPPRA